MSSENHDTRGNMRARVFTSFMIFGLLFLLSVSISVKTVAVNSDTIRDEFLSYEYVSGFSNHTKYYIEDVCKVNGIPYEGVAEVVDYKYCNTLVEQYVGGMLGNNKGFIDTTAKATAEEKKAEIVEQIKLAVSKTDYKYDEAVAQSIADRIVNYMFIQLDSLRLSTVKSITSVGSVAINVVIGVLAVFVAVLCLITYFIGVKRYRSVRAVACGFMSAGWLDIIISVMIVIISKIKTVDIFPLYLRNTFMSYFNNCVTMIVICGVCMILISYIIATVVWLQKKSMK